jgi:5'-methylthioadenosine nucleosidase
MLISHVVIAIAMEAEASPLVEHLSLRQDPSFYPPETPFRAFEGRHGDCHLTVITNGKDEVHGTGVDNVGTVPAAVATILALQKMKERGGMADLVINAGTCGGFKRNGDASVGDVFLATETAYHDRRISIPEFTPYGIGRIRSTPTKKLANHIGAKSGVCSTGNSLDFHELDSVQMEENEASVKDMEAAAVAWAAEMWKVPHFEVKVVTDVVDDEERPTDEEFLKNLGTAAKRLQMVLPEVIDYVCGKHIDDL